MNLTCCRVHSWAETNRYKDEQKLSEKNDLRALCQKLGYTDTIVYHNTTEEETELKARVDRWNEILTAAGCSDDIEQYML